MTRWSRNGLSWSLAVVRSLKMGGGLHRKACAIVRNISKFGAYLVITFAQSYCRNLKVRLLYQMHI